MIWWISCAFCCRLQISLTAPNVSFRGRLELSTGLHLQQWSRQNHVAISSCCQARNQGWRKLPLKFWTAIIEPLRKNCHDRLQPIIPPSCRSAVPTLEVNYPPGVICDSSRGNAEPNHIVVLYCERSPQKKFSTWKANIFYWWVIRLSKKSH